jgi:periplasmic divalent cation tolerance protein
MPGSKRSYAVVLVTAPNVKTARALARAALQARLVACANLIPGVESHYWWNEKVEHAKEILILFKTTASRLRPLERLVVQRHPYDTPEFVVLKITGGNQRYLRWCAATVGK